MNQQPQPPSAEKVRKWVKKNQKIMERADANILILDHIIAELEADIRKQPMYLHRLQKAKQLLDIDPSKASGQDCDVLVE
jgi:hypothetical protein